MRKVPRQADLEEAAGVAVAGSACCVWRWFFWRRGSSGRGEVGCGKIIWGSKKIWKKWSWDFFGKRVLWSYLITIWVASWLLLVAWLLVTFRTIGGCRHHHRQQRPNTHPCPHPPYHHTPWCHHPHWRHGFSSSANLLIIAFLESHCDKWRLGVNKNRPPKPPGLVKETWLCVKMPLFWWTLRKP